MKKIRCLILAVSLVVFFLGTVWAGEGNLRPKYSQYTIPTSAGSFIPVNKIGAAIASIFPEVKIGHARPQLISGALMGGRKINSAAPVMTNQSVAGTGQPPAQPLVADINKDSTVTAKDSPTFTPKLGDLRGDGKQNSGNSPVPEIALTSTPAPTLASNRWSSVIKESDGKLYWRDASKGDPQPGISYVQVLIPLTPEEIQSYEEWQTKQVTNPDPASIMVGDVTGDGTINSADLLTIKKYLAGTSQLTRDQLLAADLDGDGQVTAADATLLAKILVK